MLVRMTSRIGRFCFQHRWKVIIASVLFMIGGFACTGAVMETVSAGARSPAPESVQAAQALDGGDRGGQVVALVEGVDPEDDRVADVMDEAAAGLRAAEDVAGVGEPLTASDRSGLALTVDLAPLDDTDARDEAAVRVADRLRALQNQLPGSRVRIGGDAWLDHETRATARQDTRNAELAALPLTFLVMVFVFGGVVAAGLPLIATIVSVGGSFVLLLVLTRFTEVNGNITTVVTLLGLGLSIDYGLLLVARYREELVPAYRQALVGGSAEISREARADAVGRAWGTAGKTIVFSALTVAAALSGLLLMNAVSLQAVAAGGISAALVAVSVALTTVAALLGGAGRWIRPGKRALFNAGTGASGEVAERGLFARTARFTQRWPFPVAVVIVGLLAAASAPLLDAEVRLPGLKLLPPSMESIQVVDVMADKYGLTERPAVMVVARSGPEALASWAEEHSSDPAVTRVEPARSHGPGLSSIAFATQGDAQGAQAQGLVERLREDRPLGGKSWVAGQAAELIDVNAALRDRLPQAVAIMILAMFVLMFLLSGSVVVPLTAIVLAALSLGATFGIMVLIFQEGHLSGLLDTLTTGGLDPFSLAIVFAFAFGLSMDYEIFLISRIKEYADAGLDTGAAIRRGLQSTGRIITSAALLMLIVFGAFGAARIGDIEETGIGLCVAVLIDATLIRCLLLPAVMSVLGRANWWAPGPLRPLHARFGLHERGGTASGRSEGGRLLLIPGGGEKTDVPSDHRS